MSDIALADTVAARLHHGVLELAGRLGHLLGDDHEAAGFLAALGNRAVPCPARDHPIDRLAKGVGLSRAQIDVLLLAGAAEEHEGLASVLRALHPAGLPAPTCGLVAAMAEAGLLTDAPDDPVEARLWARELVRGSLDVVLQDESWPFPERSLRLPDGLWQALRGEPGWPAGAQEITDGVGPLGLSAALLSAPLVACASGVPATVLVDGAGDPVGAAIRLAPLLAGGGANPVVLKVPALPRRSATEIVLAALARGMTPVLVTDDLPDGVAALDEVPAPAVLVTSGPVTIATTRKAVLPVRIPPLTRSQRRQLWAGLTPDCPDAADVVPPGFGVAEAGALARDVTTAALLNGTHVRQRDLRTASGRSGTTPAGVQRIRPTAHWADLVLPEDRLTQLREAVARAKTQDVVLDRWGFLADRPGRYGVRALFCGPPGTGKTLAAEVLATAIGRDLLVVDLARMTSKWIGETEKNLAAAFDAAERGDAVLFFDEADALFGKRTEVGDARDRYANLETAYLLSRLSWFEGVAVLATNLRHNLDVAFTRRLEFVVAFDPPDEEQRLLLWRRHLPSTAPLASDVDLGVLAVRYPVTGALIRNAAVAAAFLAAEAGTPIGSAQLAGAMRREYAKAGRAYPEESS